MISNADKLKALRYTLGLTQSEMAEKIGVSETSVCNCENGYTLSHGKSKTPAQYKIKAFLEVQDISPALIAESKKFFELEDRQKTMHKHFIEGKCYRIYSTGCLGSYHRKNPSMNISWECDCIFMFLRKDGIHHVFREIRGGWTRTYTDAQLVGKKNSGGK